MAATGLARKQGLSWAIGVLLVLLPTSMAQTSDFATLTANQPTWNLPNSTARVYASGGLGGRHELGCCELGRRVVKRR